MPQLPTYTANIQSAGAGGGRRATGDDFGVAQDIGAAASLGKSVRDAAGAYLADTEDVESRRALVASSEIRAKYAKALDEAAVNGSDLGALKQQMQDELYKVGEGFQTRRGNEALALYTANTGLMFDEQANAIEIRRAASTARLEGSKFINSASAVIQSNPTYLGVAEKDADALVSTFRKISPEQRAEIANELKQSLNMAAAVSAARIDPEGTKKRLDAGEWNLNAEQRNTAINKAETEIRAKRADESYQRSLKEYEERERDEKSRDTHFKDIIAGKATRRSIMDDPNLRPQTREHLIVFMEERGKALTNQEKRSDPVAVKDLWMRIHAPDTDTRKIFNGDAIFEAVRAGRVNVSDANQLNALVANQKDENGRTIGTKMQALMTNVGRALSQDPKFTAQPALVAEIQNNYAARMYNKSEELRAQKIPPTDMFNPGSKNYVGSREFIQGAIDEARGRANGEVKLPAPKTQAEYDSLPNGATYVDTDGVTKTKKSGRTAAGKIGGL